MKEIRVCSECGKTSEQTRIYKYEDGYLCNRHYQQMKYKGEIKRTRYDKNKINIKENYAEIKLYSYYGEYKGTTIIDIEDVSKVSKYKWHLFNTGYIGTDYKRRRILLHRLLMNPRENEVIDHINRNPLDNRKSNLRICTQDKNILNSSMRSDNTSGVKGVNYSRRERKWRAYISFNKQTKHLGWFKTKDEAIKARQEAVKKYFGEYAPKERSAING